MLKELMIAAVSFSLLALCSAKLPNIEAFDEHAISAVQAEIKREVGIYLRAQKLDFYYVIEVDKHRKMVSVPTQANDSSVEKESWNMTYKR